MKNENGKLIAYPTGDRQFELLPVSETAFVRRDSNAKYNFVRNSDAGMNSANAFSGIEIQEGDNTNEAKRITTEMLVPLELLMTGKFDEALGGYRKIKQDDPDNVSINEGRLNGLGYELMQAKKLPEAIVIFKLNVEFYPQAWNTYDSLGEAFMTNGEKELAIANYKKSLELNPQNANGVQMLKKLEGK